MRVSPTPFFYRAALSLRHGVFCIALTGCGITMQMPGLFTSKPTEMTKDAQEPPADGIITPEKIGTIDQTATGSIKPALIPEKPSYLTSNDWDLVKSALHAAILEKKDEASKEWENTETRTRGSVSLINSQKIEGHSICKNFLASAVVEKQDYWFEGKYCRKQESAWVISGVKQWKKS
jgi:hypothetical protein